MKIYDQHLHTSLSFDCNEDIEKYLTLAQKNNIDTFVSTEHMDLSCRLENKDFKPDFILQDKTINKMKEKYPINILKGIEIGYKKSKIKEVDNIIQEQKFDVVIMSVHEDEKADVRTEEFLKDLNAFDSYNKYLNIIVDLLENCNNFDILGHIDYLLRYVPKIQIKKHKEKLEYIFNKLMNMDKSLECNTRFIYQFNDLSYLKYIFKLYFDCGGNNVTLGSDAHFYENYMNGFDKAENMLKEIGFNYITVYKNRQPFKIKL